MKTTAARRCADELLREAALFADRDHGEAGFLDRYGQAVRADPGLAGEALARALDARARAGAARIMLAPGDLRVAETSAGGSLVACSLAGPDGVIAVSARMVDAGSRAVAGACLRVRDAEHEFAVVTDGTGTAAFQAAGVGLVIEVGGREDAPGPGEGAGGGGSHGRAWRGRPGEGRVIPLPRAPRPEQLELVAASWDEPAAAAAGPRPIEAGGVRFLCRERRRGFDLTLLVAGLSAGMSDSAIGAFGVTFVARGRDDDRDRWIVPLAPSPLGLSGSIHSTWVSGVEEDSVEVRGARQLLTSLGDELGDDLDEVVRRSVRHADADTAWAGLSRKLENGRARTLVEAALAERRMA